MSYDVHPSVPYARAILAKLPQKTGRSFDDWVSLLDRQGPEGMKEARAWLKSDHGIGGTTAALIIERARGSGAERTDDDAYLRVAGEYVAAQYAGKKSGLRPVYDALLILGRGLGADVRVCPCKTIVPLYRNHVFVEIKPSTLTRVDLGLALKGVDRELPGRLVDTGGLAKGDRITHRIPLGSVDEIDPEVEEWLAVAYELDA